MGVLEIKIGGDVFYYIQTKKKGVYYNKFIGKDLPKDSSIPKFKTTLLKEISSGNYDIKHNTVELLEVLQDKYSYLPKDELVKLSKELKIPLIDLYGVATFYSYFKLNKPCKYLIRVCDGTACHVQGSPKIIDYLEKTLGIKPGEISSDNLFEIETVRCLGLCASAPLMVVNDKVYTKLDLTQTKTILEELKDA